MITLVSRQIVVLLCSGVREGTHRLWGQYKNMLNQTCASLNQLGNKIDLLNIFEPDTKYYQILFPLNSDCAPLDSKQIDLKSNFKLLPGGR